MMDPLLETEKFHQIILEFSSLVTPYSSNLQLAKRFQAQDQLQRGIDGVLELRLVSLPLLFALFTRHTVICNGKSQLRNSGYQTVSDKMIHFSIRNVSEFPMP
ncbi:hypothetical protein L1987_37818 [Smallanthus sonchifolius]|uniref:Uncharacterized protein n=1 Tax=Smallanthus sonchifolius TaxID=185202 RepID=A0ACB9HHE7_9ASTR|nr:hypothetical protein L1987_37818 [Smallanthus sonchifolius]